MLLYYGANIRRQHANRHAGEGAKGRQAEEAGVLKSISAAFFYSESILLDVYSHSKSILLEIKNYRNNQTWCTKT